MGGADRGLGHTARQHHHREVTAGAAARRRRSSNTFFCLPSNPNRAMGNQSEITTVGFADGNADTPAGAVARGEPARNGGSAMRHLSRAAAIAMLAFGGTVVAAGCATTRHESAGPSAHNKPAPTADSSPADGLIAEEPGLMATEDQQRARNELRKRAVPVRPPEKVIRPTSRRPR